MGALSLAGEVGAALHNGRIGPTGLELNETLGTARSSSNIWTYPPAALATRMAHKVLAGVRLAPIYVAPIAPAMRPT